MKILKIYISPLCSFSVLSHSLDFSLDWTGACAHNCPVLRNKIAVVDLLSCQIVKLGNLCNNEDFLLEVVVTLVNCIQYHRSQAYVERSTKGSPPKKNIFFRIFLPNVGRLGG